MPNKYSHEELFQQTSGDEDIWQREDRCRKTLKTVGKAIFMRLVMMVLLIVVGVNSQQKWFLLILLPVVLMNLGGILPLWKEWKIRKKELNEILEEE